MRLSTHPCAKTERNRALIADYVHGGLSRREVARKYGIEIGGVNTLLSRYRVRLPAHERSRRIVTQVPPKSPGRPPVWPDCPPHLFAEYDRLRRRYGYSSAEARAMLDPGMQA